MTVPISNVVRRVVFAPSGTGPYAFTFEILAATDIQVYKGDTLLTLTTDYTVTINANGTGEVTLVATAGTDNITIVGARTIQRTTDFVTGGDLFANSLNDELDSLTIFTQQNAEAGDRSIKAPVTDPTNINMTLPIKTARAGKYLSFNSSTGNPEVVNTVVDVTTVAGIASNINTVAGISANVSTVAGAAGNVNTVAGISGNVNTVAGISGNVTTVAGIAADVTTVAANIVDIQSAEQNADDAIAAKVAAESARDATLAAYDNFDDRYLGAKASDPSLDNDGNALVAGSLYFNTGDGAMKVYTGSAWVAAYVSGTGFVDLASAQTVTGVKTFDNGLNTDTISEETAAAGVTIDGVLLKDSQVSTDQINEKTSAAGVTIDGVLLKDATVTANSIKASGTSSSEGVVELYEDTDNGTNFVAVKAPASIASNVTFTLPNADGTNGQILQTNGSGALSFTTISEPPTGLGTLSNTQNFTSSGTWTKPASGDYVVVRIWGAGGGGGKGGSANNQLGGGGGGGAMVEKIFNLSAFGSTETVTIGAGGAGATTANTAGANGGNSTFGSHVTAYGGGGGGGGIAGQGGGGGGDGSAGSQGANNLSGGNFANGGSTNIVAQDVNLGIVYTSIQLSQPAYRDGAYVTPTDYPALQNSTPFAAVSSFIPTAYSYIGGGNNLATGAPFGAGASGGAATLGSGPTGRWGGGGGGPGIATGTSSPGGAATFLGDGTNIKGGDGASNANNATNGSQPACGGGGSEQGDGGAGGAGQCTVWVFTA